MAANDEILKSFLISLGFKTDETSLKKFTGSIFGVTKGATIAGGALLGVAAAAEVMVGRFANSMEKLYYASQRTGATVGNIQGIELGSQRAGLEAGKATAALEGMARAIRTQPAMRGFMDKLLGTDTSKMDQTKAMLAVIEKLSSMPHAIGSKFAAMFGMDEETFLMMKKALPEINAAMERHNQLLKDAGIDADKAALASKNYENNLRSLGESWDVLSTKMKLALMPTLDRAHVEAKNVIDKTISYGFLGGFKQLGKSLNEWMDPEGTKKFKESQNRKGHDTGTLPITGNSSVSNAGELFNKLEQQYKLPAGLQDKMWKKESNRGDPRYMESSAGAKGHFGFMGPTAKEYGVTDPNDLTQAATGSARYMHWLMNRYAGDVQKALAAYNMGPGKFDEYSRIGKQLPKQTQDYVKTISGSPINMKTDIHVNGAGDPRAVAENVLGSQTRLYADVVRQMSGAGF